MTKKKNSISFQPVGQTLLIERREIKEEEVGGIIIPTETQQVPRDGLVVKLGTGYLKEDGTRTDFIVQEGDYVLFDAYAGQQVALRSGIYTLLAETDIIGIFDPDDILAY